MDTDPGCIGLVGIDMHFSECTCFDTHECAFENQAAVLVAHANIDKITVLQSESFRVFGIGMYVPRRDDQPVRAEGACSPHNGDGWCSVQPSAVAHRNVNAEYETVGPRHFDLGAGSKRSEDRNPLQPSLRPLQRDAFTRDPVAGLPQHSGWGQNIARSE